MTFKYRLVGQPVEAEVADAELVCGQFKLASCDAHQWYDFYIEVTPHMVEIEDNIVFEVEMQADQYEANPGGISIHLYQGTIPLGARAGPLAHARPRLARTGDRAVLAAPVRLRVAC